MNAAAFRYLYDYHFDANRKIWDTYFPQLSDEQFGQAVDYSHGSVRDQFVHIMDADEAWFSDLRGFRPAETPQSTDMTDRDQLWAHRATVDQHMRDYLETVQDDELLGKPFTEGEDKDLILWQILLHVVNHGTDHRAQILRTLNDLGVETSWQDFIFYAYEHP